MRLGKLLFHIENFGWHDLVQVLFRNDRFCEHKCKKSHINSRQRFTAPLTLSHAFLLSPLPWCSLSLGTEKCNLDVSSTADHSQLSNVPTGIKAWQSEKASLSRNSQGSHYYSHYYCSLVSPDESHPVWKRPMVNLQGKWCLYKESYGTLDCQNLNKIIRHILSIPSTHSSKGEYVSSGKQLLQRLISGQRAEGK